MATHNDILEVIHLMKRLPNSPITGNSIESIRQSLEETAALFFAVLEDLPAAMVKAAAVQYCSEGNPFFPTPGVLRDKAMELQMIALGIPSPAEAWGMVLTARQYVEPVSCERGLELREAIEKSDDYWEAIQKYSHHTDNCGDCSMGGYQEVYAHPAVAETVKLLGGRDVILTDNPVADRARFIEAYREVIARERMKMAMTPKVAEFVESSRPMLAGSQVKQLAQRLAK